MTDPVTRLQLENAGLDAASLAAVVNGGPEDTVVTRTGRELVTLAGIPALVGTREVPLGQPIYRRYGDSDMTITTPAGATAYRVWCFSGGGSGGSSDAAPASASCGSGGGGCGKSVSYQASPGATLTIVAGAGGAAPAPGPYDGNHGEDTTCTDSTHGLVCMAEGGQGGTHMPQPAHGSGSIVGGGGGNHDNWVATEEHVAGSSGHVGWVVTGDTGVDGTLLAYGGQGGTGADGAAGGKEASSDGTGHGPGGGALTRGTNNQWAGAVGAHGYAIVQFFTQV